MSSRKVYVVSDTGHDFSGCLKYGDPVFIYEGKTNVFAVDQMCREIHAVLKDSDQADYLITSGNSLAACAAFGIMMEMHGAVNALIYSFRNVGYELRTIRRHQLVLGGSQY